MAAELPIQNPDGTHSLNVDLGTVEGQIIVAAYEALLESRRRYLAGRSVRRTRRFLLLRCNRSAARRRQREEGVALAVEALQAAVAAAVLAFRARRQRRSRRNQ